MFSNNSSQYKISSIESLDYVKKSRRVTMKCHVWGQCDEIRPCVECCPRKRRQIKQPSQGLTSFGSGLAVGYTCRWSSALTQRPATFQVVLYKNVGQILAAWVHVCMCVKRWWRVKDQSSTKSTQNFQRVYYSPLQSLNRVHIVSALRVPTRFPIFLSHEIRPLPTTLPDPQSYSNDEH